MMRAYSANLLAIVVAMHAACSKPNPHYCADLNAPGCSCTVSEDCASDLFPICDPSSNICVECTIEHAETCAADRFACVENACSPCTEHAQCGATSNVCAPDGKCADPLEVAYVDPVGTDNPDCTKEAPCTRVSTALATNRAFVKLTGILDEAVVVEGDRDVAFLADPGAKLTRTSNNEVLIVKNGARLRVLDLEIADALGPVASIYVFAAALELIRVKVRNNASSGIQVSSGSLSLLQSSISDNTNSGIVADDSIVTAVQSTFSNNMSRGLEMFDSTGMIEQSSIVGNLGEGAIVSDTQLTLTQSEVTGNGGGISANGGLLAIAQTKVSENRTLGVGVYGAQFSVTNNQIVRNGASLATGSGGVTLNAPDGGMRRFDFNTVANNLGSGSVTGVSCSAMQPFTLSGNIVYGNAIQGSGGRQVTIQNCSWIYSNIGPGQDTLGLGNRNANPMFVDPSQGDFHLRPESPLKNAADPNATLDVDIDGDARPQDGVRDIGADEIKQ